MISKVAELIVNAEQDMMLIIRMTTSGVLSKAGLELDAIEDMKIAVDEACSGLMQQSVHYTRLQLTYRYDSECVHILIKGLDADHTASFSTFPDNEQNNEILRCILESTADKSTITQVNGRLETIELFKRSASVSGVTI